MDKVRTKSKEKREGWRPSGPSAEERDAKEYFGIYKELSATLSGEKVELPDDPKEIFVGLRKDMIRFCPQWLALSLEARAIYICIKARWTGPLMRGWIYFTHEDAKTETGLCSRTVTKAFHELLGEDLKKRVKDEETGKTKAVIVPARTKPWIEIKKGMKASADPDDPTPKTTNHFKLTRTYDFGGSSQADAAADYMHRYYSPRMRGLIEDEKLKRDKAGRCDPGEFVKELLGGIDDTPDKSAPDSGKMIGGEELLDHLTGDSEKKK